LRIVLAAIWPSSPRAVKAWAKLIGNLAVLKHITLNLIRLDPVKRKGGIKARRLIAATSDAYRAELLGLQ
jgi:hypothetical protein